MTPPGAPIVLREHGAGETHSLPDQVAVAFSTTFDLVHADPIGPGRWRLKPKGRRVGVVQAGGVELRVLPKLEIRRLLYLAGFAPGAERRSYRWYDADVELAEEDGLVAVMAKFLIKLAGRALHPSVLHGYRERDETAMVLRGRLRVADQAQRHPGLVVPVETRYDDLTTDIPENQVLRAAIQTMLRLPGVPAWDQAELRRLLTGLTGVRDLPPDALPPTPPTRLNDHYQPALRLARLILTDRSAEHVHRHAAAGRVRATGFVLHMDKVFQGYLTGALRERLVPRYGGILQTEQALKLREAGSGKTVTSCKPDLIWRHPNRTPLAVIDAKYKGRPATAAQAKGATWSGSPLGVPVDDLYQVFTYCKLLGLDQGHIVHADDTVGQRQVVQIADVQLVIHRLDLDAPLPQLREQADALARDIAQGAGRTPS